MVLPFNLRIRPPAPSSLLDTDLYLVLLSLELLEQVLNCTPGLWTICFLYGLTSDIELFQKERSRRTAPAQSKCRFGQWEEVESQLPGILANIARLRAAIIALGPWYLMPVAAKRDGGKALADALEEWTQASVHESVFPKPVKSKRA
jgi:hypothetical protein